MFFGKTVQNLNNWPLPLKGKWEHVYKPVCSVAWLSGVSQQGELCLSVCLAGLAGRGGGAAAGTDRAAPAPEWGLRGPEPIRSEQLCPGPREVQYLYGAGTATRATAGTQQGSAAWSCHIPAPRAAFQNMFLNCDSSLARCCEGE